MHTDAQNAFVHSVNISEKKGTTKHPVDLATVSSQGIEGDAHAGPWHRQVSLLSLEQVEAFGIQSGKLYSPGDFAENVTVSQLPMETLCLFDKLMVGSAELEITQFGKECHGNRCAIYDATGDCIMPRTGVFARVTGPGTVKPGDPVIHQPVSLGIDIVTVSDSVSSGMKSDESGDLLATLIMDHAGAARMRVSIRRSCVPDDADVLRETISRSLDESPGLLVTTGGTGIGPRDITPETVEPFCTKLLPSIPQAVQSRHATTNPRVLLSRSLAGTSDSTLVFCLPGSPKAVREYTEVILPLLQHAMLMLRGLGH